MRPIKLQNANATPALESSEKYLQQIKADFGRKKNCCKESNLGNDRPILVVSRQIISESHVTFESVYKTESCSGRDQ